MWESAQSQSHGAFPGVGVVVVQGTEPAQLNVKIVGGDAVKAIESLFEAPVTGDAEFGANATAERRVGSQETAPALTR